MQPNERELTMSGLGDPRGLRVSAVIPNFNGRELLERHLPAVCAALRSGDELVIVDDASTDESVAWLCETYQLQPTSLPTPEIASYWPPVHEGTAKLYAGAHTVQQKTITLKLLVFKKNQRFAAAANAGVAVAKNPYIFLLNNDVSPEPTALKQLLGHFADQNVFAVGCLEFDGVMHDQASRRDITGESNHGSTGNQSGKNILWFAQGLYQHSGVAQSELTAGETAWVSGGSGVFDREKWLQLGGFDARFYPAYWEDVELSHRARKQGWKVLFEPKAVVQHQHETTNATEFGSTGIEKTSWHHADLFTRLHATPLQRLQYWLWHPVWLWRRWRRSKDRRTSDSQ
jgi:GT2 family glycosyltransferase